VVPASVLEPFSGQSGYLFYGQYNETDFYAGPFAIRLTAINATASAVDYP
jgi:hypothetical protein